MLPASTTLFELIGYTRLDGVVFMAWIGWMILVFSLGDNALATRLSPWAWAIFGIVSWFALWPQSPQ